MRIPQRFTLIAIIIFSAVLTIKAQKQEKLLSKAFQHQSTKKLEVFLNKWNEEVITLKEAELGKLSYAAQQAYQVYNAYYNPLNISNLGGSEFGNDIYMNVKYFIIQNQLEIFQKKKVYYTPAEEKEFALDKFMARFTEDSVQKIVLRLLKSAPLGSPILKSRGPNSPVQEFEKPIRIEVLSDFRPRLDHLKQKKLILTPTYKKILTDFLGSEFNTSPKTIMGTAVASNKSLGKQNFINQKVRVFPSHWGGKWELLTFPMIRSITFDEKFEYVKIKFSIIYEGGQAFMKKENGKWILMSAERTSIQ